MDEFAALAQRVVLTMDDVRGCLVLSRDGMVLGAFPDDQEAELKPAWLRFTHVGEARKGFVEFSDQLWAFVHRGPYAAFVVTGTSVRPGVMLDQLEQAVIAAEEARAKQKEITLKVPDAASAPSGRPRTSLHPPADRAPASAVPATTAAEGQEMPTFAAPSGLGEEAAPAAPWDGATPEQRQQMEAMRQQMAAMQAQIEQQALQAGAAPAAAPAPAPATAPPGAPAGGQPISGYRRPETSPAPAPASVPADPAPASAPDLSSRPRPSIEGSPYESVLADDAQGSPRPFGAESSPFARLEAEQAQAAAEGAPPAARPAERPAAAPAPTARPADQAFTSEPQQLASADAAAPAQEQDEGGEVDRVMLAKEFSGLLQVDGDGDEE
jgi:hypothetical protein